MHKGDGTAKDRTSHRAAASSAETQLDSTGSCCISCGDRFVTKEFIELFRPFEGPDVILAGTHENGKYHKRCPRKFIGNTAYIRMFLKPGLFKKPLTFDVSEVCRRHIRGECDKGGICKFLHVCRQWWKSRESPGHTDGHIDENTCQSCGNAIRGRTPQCAECPGALMQVAFSFIHDLSQSVQTVEAQWAEWIFGQNNAASLAQQGQQPHASAVMGLRNRRQKILLAMQRASQTIKEDEPLGGSSGDLQQHNNNLTHNTHNEPQGASSALQLQQPPPSSSSMSTLAPHSHLSLHAPAPLQGGPQQRPVGAAMWAPRGNMRSSTNPFLAGGGGASAGQDPTFQNVAAALLHSAARLDDHTMVPVVDNTEISLSDLMKLVFGQNPPPNLNLAQLTDHHGASADHHGSSRAITDHHGASADHHGPSRAITDHHGASADHHGSSRAITDHHSPRGITDHHGPSRAIMDHHSPRSITDHHGASADSSQSAGPGADGAIQGQWSWTHGLQQPPHDHQQQQQQQQPSFDNAVLSSLLQQLGR